MDKPLHPRHPGVGRPTSLIRLEADQPEVGGVIYFFPSGATKICHWRGVRPIDNTLEMAKKLVTEVLDSLLKEGNSDDIERTNVPSLVAASQRIVMDWNDKLRQAIGGRMTAEFGDGASVIDGLVNGRRQQ
jgi:hypothetical protein